MYSARKCHAALEFTLSFEDFLTFIEILNCHYCNGSVMWQSHYTGGSRSGRSYNLDRKNNSQGYSKTNCVVCCKICNQVKGNILTYEEMMVLAPSLKQIQEDRANAKTQCST